MKTLTALTVIINNLYNVDLLKSNVSKFNQLA